MAVCWRKRNVQITDFDLMLRPFKWPKIPLTRLEVRDWAQQYSLLLTKDDLAVTTSKRLICQHQRSATPDKAQFLGHSSQLLVV